MLKIKAFLSVELFNMSEILCRYCYLMVCSLLFPVFGNEPPRAKFELKEGDRVVLVGSTIIEREQQYGHVELMLHRMFPDRSFTVRNLGWSGDTVRGEARPGFGSVEDGFKKLVEQIIGEKPTVLIVGYGTNEAFWKGDARKQFAVGIHRFLTAVKQPELRLIFVTPLSSASSGAKVNYQEIRQVLTEQKEKYQGWLVDLMDLYQKEKNLTDDGIIPNDRGYRVIAQLMADQLTVSAPVVPTNDSWEKLRQLIIEKNRLYFHRYRPQNETYLFGFRKYEQGQNAKEVPQFEPLVAELDQKINDLKRTLASEKK